MGSSSLSFEVLGLGLGNWFDFIQDDCPSTIPVNDVVEANNISISASALLMELIFQAHRNGTTS